MSASGPTLVRVLDTRFRDGCIEGLCELDDGTTEWREPTSITAEGTVTRVDGRVEHVEIDCASVNLTGAKPCE